MADYNSAKEEIKSRCNIVDVVSAAVPLKKAGSNWKGCCPFHKEKTASFVVSETKQIYHCFGCGASGDAIGFTMNFYNLSFPETIERLAAQYGVNIDQYQNETVSNKAAYYDINKQAASFYWDALRNTRDNPALRYMKERGIEAKTLQIFGIGYADGEWQSLSDSLLKNGADRNMMVELGLLSVKEGHTYDKFRDRVIFPIIDTRKRVIGFGGRIIGQGEPKYLNSQESPVFLKKNNLYALNITKNAIQEEGYAYLVEGYMDVVSLYQAGVKNVTASLGTALTENQAKLLKKYAKKVVLCYDSDLAGIKAALRGIDILRNQGFEIRVLNVTGAKDPDEYIKKNGKEAFLKLTDENSYSDVEYKVMLIARKYDVRDTEQGIKYLKAVAKVLKSISPVESDIYIKKIARQSGISEGALRREVENTAPDNIPQINENIGNSKKEIHIAVSNKQKDNSSLVMEKTMLKLSLLHSEYFEAFNEFPEITASSEGEEIRKVMAEMYRPESDFDLSVIKESLSEEGGMYFDSVQSLLTGEDNTAYEDCINKLKINRIDVRCAELTNALDLLGGDDDPRADEILKELVELQKSKKMLKKAGKQN